MLFSYWQQGKRKILAAKAMAFIPEWKTQQYNCEECKETLIPVNDFIKTNSNNTTFWVAPHFSHKPESTCKYSKNESEEHKSKKARLLSFLFLEKVSLDLHGFNFFLKKEFVKDVEVTRKNNRADVLVEFETYNPLFGNGIVFEIMESESNESIETKTTEWIKKGYTLISIQSWESIAETDTLKFQCKNTYLETITAFCQESEKRLRNLINEVKQIQLPLYQSIKFSDTENNCSNCKYSTQDRTISGIEVQNTFCCWLWKNKGLQKLPDKKNRNQICNFWEGK